MRMKYLKPIAEHLPAIAQHIPVAGQLYGLAKTAMKVYNCTSPVEAVKLAAKSIVVDCSSPMIKYPIRCSILFAELALVITSEGRVNPFTIAMVLGSAKQIIEK